MYNKILATIKEMTDSEIVTLWNEYARQANRYDDEILDSYELEEWLSNAGDTISILNRFYFGSDAYNKEGGANPNRNYFTFNGYGNIISFDYIYNQYLTEGEGFEYIEISDLINYIIDNNDPLYNDDIQEILDSAQVEE